MDLTSATVVAHSVWDGTRLVTFRLTFPRFILAEFNTHRAFSRNSASSRAIPINRQVELLRENPFIPQAWPKNQRGMSADEYLMDYGDLAKAWLRAMDYSIARAMELSDYGVHKQIANRLLEPFMWHTVIMSTTMPGLENFFAQRDHPDAQPEIRVLARKMREALDASTPVERSIHIPFLGTLETPANEDALGTWESAFIVAISKCARVSYGRELEERTFEQDKALVVRLARDKHLSPFEHVGWADDTPWLDENGEFLWYPEEDSGGHTGNFESPWKQARHEMKRLLPSIAVELDAIN